MDKGTALWNVVADTFGLHLDETSPPLAGYNHNVAALPDPTATLRGLFLAYLNDPCHVEVPWQQETPAQKLPPGYGPQNSDERTGGILQPWGNQYSPEQQQAAYNIYRLASDYACNVGRVHLPIGKRSDNLAPSAVVIDLHGGLAHRVIRIEAERLALWPTLPKPEDIPTAAIPAQRPGLEDFALCAHPQCRRRKNAVSRPVRGHLCPGPLPGSE